MATTNKNFRVKNGLEVGNAIGVGTNGISFGTAGQILSSNGSSSPAIWIDNYSTAIKHEVKLAESINKGQAVYVSSAVGNNMLVSKASNATETTSSKTMGLLDAGGVTNDFVNVVTEGLVTGTEAAPLDTSAANSEGDPVWLGTSGNLIYGANNAPKAPNHLVFIGIVTRKHAVVGEIFVRVQNGFETSELHDVYINGLANGQVLYRANVNGSNSLWTNGSLADANIAALTGATFTGNVAGTNLSLSGDANVAGKLSVTARSGDEGGEIFLANAVTNTTIVNGITIDVYQDKIRFFEQGGSARGAYIDISAAGAGVGTNLLASSGGGTTYTNGTGLSLSGTTFSLANSITVSNLTSTNVNATTANITTIYGTTVNAITVNATANVIAGKYYGDGSTMSNVGVITSSTPPSVTSVLWVDTSANASTTIPSSTMTAKGDILVATANNTPTRLAVGSNGQVLVANSSAATGVSWEYGNSLASSLPTGYYINAPIMTTVGTSSTYNIPAGRTYYTPYIPSADMTLASISIIIGGSATGSTIRIGLYSTASGGIPGTLLADWGTVSGATTGTKTITGLSTTLSGGKLYWLAMSSLGGNPTPDYLLPNNGNIAQAMDMIPSATITTSTTATPTTYYETYTAGSLPATASSTLTTSTAIRLFWLGVGV